MKQQNGFIDPVITIGAVGAVVVLGQKSPNGSSAGMARWGRWNAGLSF